MTDQDDPYGLPDPRWDAGRGDWIRQQREQYRLMHGKEMPVWNDPEEQERRRRDMERAWKNSRGRTIRVITQEQSDFIRAEQDLRRQADELAQRARDRASLKRLAG